MKKLAALVVGALVFPVFAYAVPIIQFAQTSGSNTITATANAGDTATTITGSGVAVNVTQDLGGFLGAALFSINATSTDSAVPAGTGALQHYSGSFSITSGALNVLSGTFTDAALGVGSAITLAIGAPPDVLNLTSDQIPPVDLVPPSAAAFSLTNVIPPITIVGSTIDSFTATVSGNVSASVAAMPEPSSLAILALGIGAVGFLRRKRQEYFG